MNNIAKLLIGTGVVLTGGYLLQMRRTSANLETEISAKIHSIKLSGILIRIDAKLKNPTNGTLKLKYPFVKLIYKGSTIGTSQVVNQDITLPAYGEANIESILINIPLTGILSVAMDLLKSLKTGAGITVVIAIITTIYTAFSTLPYEYKIEQVVKADNNK
jgi:hypothetical protein